MKTKPEIRTVANGKVKELKREQLLDNLDYLLMMNAMTHAELEKAAGIYTGYISRMKSDPRKLPALDAIWKMAQVLGVSLEWLIEGTTRDLEENILYIQRFLQKLFDLTAGGKLIWKHYSFGQLKRIAAGQEACTHLPCIMTTPEGGCRASSLAFPEMDSDFADAAFTTQMDEKHVLCIVKMRYEALIEDGNPASLLLNEWIELQTLDTESGARSLITATNYNGDTWMEDGLEKLYQQLMTHCTDLQLGPGLKSMIDSFMNQWNDV